jgi:hypothetical protein
MIWIANARRGEGKCFVARADNKLTAFVELESAFGPAAFAHPRVFHKNSFFVDRRMSASSSAIKHTCACLDNRKHLEDSPTHCSSNAGVSSEAFESDKRRFTISRRHGTRGPHVFLRT